MSPRPTWAEVDLEAFRSNVRNLKAKAGRARLMAVLKDDAFGHGGVECARAALEAGADRLAVAYVEEAIPLRRAGIDAPLHLIGPLEPTQADDVVECRLVPSVATAEVARALSSAAGRGGVRLPVHVKVDVGLGRLGVPPAEAPDLCRLVRSLPGLELEGLYSHLSSADDGDVRTTRREYGAFLETARRVEAALGAPVPLKHVAASTVTIESPEMHLDMVRPGIALYGYHPAPRLRPLVDLRPVMQVKTRVSQVRPVERGAGVGYGRRYKMPRAGPVAAIPIGSGDGLDRRVARAGHVLVRGRRVPVAAVCLDVTVLDTSLIPDIRPGEEVIVLGSQGGEAVWADTIAGWIGTVRDTVLCGFTARVPRRYFAG